MKKFIQIIFLFLGTFLYQSCVEDEIMEKGDNGAVATIQFSLSFPDMDIVSPTARSAGDAIEAISDVCILFYDTEGNLKKDDNGNPIYIYSGTSATYENKVEDGTQKVTFTKKLKPDSYCIYAVANMGDLTANEYASTIESVTGLRTISLSWNTEIAHNNQMFGFFQRKSDADIISNGETDLSKINPTDHEAPVLQLTGTTGELVAKLYRAASKVTVAFDASELKTNVFITINSVRLMNAPMNCGLWTTNTPNTKQELMEVGDQIDYTEDEMTVARKENQVFYGSHEDNAESLFMFENRQGTVSAIKNQTEKVISNKPIGTYIEISGYYRDQTPGEANQGPIIYRYMLGEDKFSEGIFNNFNVTRNRHYKVTLHFKGKATTEPTWRVEYDEEKEEINVPDIIYISYLSEEKLPIQVAFPKAGNNRVTCKAEITDNPWYYKNHEYIASTNINNANGFLTFEGQLSSDAIVHEANTTQTLSVSQVDGKMIGTLNFQTDAMAFKGKAEQGSSYTGYNPFFAHEREATVKLSYSYATGSGENVRDTKEIKVRQAKRVVNPMGIFRRNDNTAPFHVTVMEQAQEDGDMDFVALDSYGPWTVSVDKDYSKDEGNWIKIGKTAGGDERKIEGTAGEISFYYAPRTAIENGEVRCGRIKIEYHNNYCTHYIYVRQGYASVPFSDGSGKKWSSYNLIGINSKNVMQKEDSPLGEGSFLKEKSSIGILAANNSTYGFGNENKGKSFTLSNGSKASWDKASNTTSPGTYPTSGQYNYIVKSTNKGFGVVYDDKATETATTARQAFTFPEGTGMRGLVVQDKGGEHNVLFFPIGKYGYGRRRNAKSVYSDKSEWSQDVYGELHYAYASEKADKPEARPLLADLYKYYGAIYWTQSLGDGSRGFSFNYNICNIEAGIYKDWASRVTGDALYVRLVE